MRARVSLLWVAAIAPLVGCGLGPIVDIGTSLYDAGVEEGPDGGTDTKSDAGQPRADGGPDPARPDLVVRIASPTPAALVPGDLVELTVGIENQGMRASPATSARVDLEQIDSPMKYEIGIISDVAPTIGERIERTRILVAPTTLAPGSYRIVVTADPDGRVVESNESNNIARSAPIAVSFVSVTPSRFDFGTVGVGCRAVLPGRIENLGARRTFVTTIGKSPDTDAVFGLVAPETPATLDAANALDFLLTYEPDAAAINLGTVIIDHTDFTVALAVQGRGEVDPRREDRFVQRAKPKVDILVVVDDSPSMADQQPALVRSASAFFRRLEDRGIDFSLAVTTTDVTALGAGGKFIGTPKVLTPGPTMAREFELRLGVGTGGAEPASGLEASRQALSPELLASDNAGFLRADAALALVYIADENDRAADPVDDYLSYFRTLKSPEGESRFAAYAIVGPPGGCSGATEGTRYTNLVQQTSGLTESICTLDWRTALEDFPGGGLGYQQRFELTRLPLDGSIELQVNGIPLPAIDPQTLRPNWRYEDAPPAIVFEPIAVPEPNAEIVVRYRTAC